MALRICFLNVRYDTCYIDVWSVYLNAVIDANKFQIQIPSLATLSIVLYINSATHSTNTHPHKHIPCHPT